MALKKATLESISSLLKITPEALTKAITAAEEVDLEGFSPDGLTVLTAEELTARDTNTKKSVEAGYKTAGREIALKEIKEAAGLTDVEGKDAKKIAEAIKSAALTEAKIAPDQQVKELQTQLKALETARDEAIQGKTKAEQMAQTVRFEREIIGAFPARGGELSDEDRLALFNMRYEAADVEGVGRVWKNKADGSELRDKVSGKPLQTGDVIKGFFDNMKWTETPGGGKDGRGGVSNPPGGGGAKPTKYSEAAKAWEDSGKSVNSAEFQTHISELAKVDGFEMDLPGMG